MQSFSAKSNLGLIFNIIKCRLTSLRSNKYIVNKILLQNEIKINIHFFRSLSYKKINLNTLFDNLHQPE